MEQNNPQKNNAKAYFDEAVKACNEKDLVNAVAKLTQALTHNPDFVDALWLRGQLLMAMGDSKGAENDMRRLLQLNPNIMNTLNGNYKAEGKEQTAQRHRSNLNPYGL